MTIPTPPEATFSVMFTRRAENLRREGRCGLVPLGRASRAHTGGAVEEATGYTNKFVTYKTDDAVERRGRLLSALGWRLRMIPLGYNTMALSGPLVSYALADARYSPS
jgi:hypothetical protein